MTCFKCSLKQGLVSDPNVLHNFTSVPCTFGVVLEKLIEADTVNVQTSLDPLRIIHGDCGVLQCLEVDTVLLGCLPRDTTCHCLSSRYEFSVLVVKFEHFVYPFFDCRALQFYL